MPAVLVDRLLVQGADLNLEPFAIQDPSRPWHDANARLRNSDDMLGLWRLRPERLIASALQTGPEGLAEHNRVLLLIGDTYEVQLSWSALWTCRIGACDLDVS